MALVVPVYRERASLISWGEHGHTQYQAEFHSGRVGGLTLQAVLDDHRVAILEHLFDREPEIELYARFFVEELCRFLDGCLFGACCEFTPDRGRAPRPRRRGRCGARE